MSDLLTIDDLINKVHHLVEYNVKSHMVNDTILKPILSPEEQINVKFFKSITNFKLIKYYDNYINLQQHYKPNEIEFFSFLYCIFNDISDDFNKSSEKEDIILNHINDFIIKIKNGDVVKETPTFELKKDILNNFKLYILTHNLIQFISIYFDINIFVIDNDKNCVIFYTLNQTFNRFKHSIILIKSQHIDFKNNITNYYKNVYYNDSTQNQTLPLLNEIFNNYPKMVIYSERYKLIDPSIDNINYLIVKQVDDNDLNIIHYNITNNNKIHDIKTKRKIERKNKKDSIKQDTTESPETTESMINNIMVITYTPDILNSKDYSELRQLAKSNGIKLSYVIKENGKDKRITKKKPELIEELLKKYNK